MASGWAAAGGWRGIFGSIFFSPGISPSCGKTIPCCAALPGAWQRGSFHGLRARGGFEVSAAWEAGRLQTIEITSRHGNPGRLRYGDKVIELRLRAGASLRWHGTELVPAGAAESR